MKDELYPGLSSPSIRELFPEREIQIMEAALEVFSEKGFASSSTREIAQRAGIAEGTIFRYFKTKKDILIQLASTLFEKIFTPLVIKWIEEVLAKHRDLPLEEVLRLIIHDRLAVIRANSRYLKLFMYELQYNDDFKRNFFHEIIWNVSNMLADYFAEQQQKGVIRAELDPRRIFFSLIGLVGIFVLWREFFNGDEKAAYSDDEIVNHITDILLHGILTK